MQFASRGGDEALGMYACQQYMGNGTSGRSVSFPSTFKRAVGSQSASKLTFTVKRMDAYFKEKLNCQSQKKKKNCYGYNT